MLEMEVQPEEIRSLLEYFSKNTYKARDSHPKVQQVMQKCLGLFALDYTYSVVSNTYGELSTNYPSNLVILETEKGSCSPTPAPFNINLNNGNGHDVNFGDGGTSSGNGCETGILIDLDVENDIEIDSNECQVPSTYPEEPSLEEMTSNLSSNGLVDLLMESSTEESFSSIPSPNFNVHINGNSNGNGGPGGVGGSGYDESCSMSSLSGGPIEPGEASKLKDLCSKARFARCRARFPVPVILYNQKHICRSATLSGGPEIYGRSSLDYFFSGGNVEGRKGGVTLEGDAEDAEEIVVAETQSDWQLFDRVRAQDIRLLKSFQVQTIVDLMVEKKKVKFGVYVTSSEKVDKENRYGEFNLLSLPYPGCEFFKDYRDKGYSGEDLVFQWNQGHVDANIFVPYDPTTASLNTDWSQYRNWDLVTLTQKYLKLLLAYLRDGNKGLLVHCISGWDRTPLFISLLRLSLWADGVIHKSLCAEQILYLTLAYDWLLFGHNLADRLSKGEEILFFCFYFLKYIVDSEFSVHQDQILTSTSTPTPVSASSPTLTPTSTVPPSPAKDHKLSRVRNNSDIQLDGVLLDCDGSQTSPEGSNWSLNSCGSSLSNRSQDNPPSYFQVVPESSWEDHHPLNRRSRHSSNHLNHANQNQNQSRANGNGNVFSFIKSSSTTATTTTTNPSFFSSANGHSPSSNTSLSSLGNQDLQEPNGGFTGRTSPVAVPLPNRTSRRPDSTSSASIGSWQLITGTGSLRETVSTSEPSSTSSHSFHPLRLPVNGVIDCIEASESSITLVEELTPVEPLCDPLSCTFKENGWLEDSVEGGWPLGGEVGVPVGPEDKTPINVTPTKSHLSQRRERLQTVRAHFYTLYASAIGFQFKNIQEPNGLGFLIGNFATKVGIRSANRTTNF